MSSSVPYLSMSLNGFIADLPPQLRCWPMTHLADARCSVIVGGVKEEVFG